MQSNQWKSWKREVASENDMKKKKKTYHQLWKSLPFFTLKSLKLSLFSIFQHTIGSFCTVFTIFYQFLLHLFTLNCCYDFVVTLFRQPFFKNERARAKCHGFDWFLLIEVIRSPLSASSIVCKFSDESDWLMYLYVTRGRHIQISQPRNFFLFFTVF